MDRRFFVIANGGWFLTAGQHQKQLEKYDLCPLGKTPGHLGNGCNVLVKFRAPDGIHADDASRIEEFKGEYFVKSQNLSSYLLRNLRPDHFVSFFFEGTGSQARCIVRIDDGASFHEVEARQPTLRLIAFGLPPIDYSLADEPSLVRIFYQTGSSKDPELFAGHASTFLDAPHILVPLCIHVSSLNSSDSLEFTIQLKKVAEQLRNVVLNNSGRAQVQKLEKNHLETWAEAQGREIAFLDGGVARVSALAHLEPMALRVGIYMVRPGERVPETRESWSMQSFVVGDLLDPTDGLKEQTDRKRLLEAVRYVLEPLCGLHFLRQHPDTWALFLHGPLINQFHMYDEGEPNFIPSMSPHTLQSFDISEPRVLDRINFIPEHPVSGRPMWNQFMAVYGFVMLELFAQRIPIVGVIERAGGRALGEAFLQSLVEDQLVTQPYVERLRQIFDRYDINDEFLFGCILREGEYITPLAVNKNLVRRARERWQLVVQQYPSPYATMLKTDDGAFPFRIEMNAAAREHAHTILQLSYHTSRLLPRYAFPVGLDIADKYAKIPDWIAKGISDEVAARVLRKALQSGDAQIVAQVRRFLAIRPRDFFFRPKYEP